MPQEHQLCGQPNLKVQPMKNLLDGLLKMAETAGQNACPTSPKLTPSLQTQSVLETVSNESLVQREVHSQFQSIDPSSAEPQTQSHYGSLDMTVESVSPQSTSTDTICSQPHSANHPQRKTALQLPITNTLNHSNPITAGPQPHMEPVQSPLQQDKDSSQPHPQGQSPLSNQQQTTGCNVNTQKQPAPTQPLLPSIGEDKVSHILKGFMKILEKKSLAAGIFKPKGTPGQSTDCSDCNALNDSAEMSSSGGRNSCSIENEQLGKSMVKSEIIEGDEDCLITGIDMSKKIFALPKEYHGATIILDNDDDDPVVVKMEVDASPNEDVLDSSSHNDTNFVQDVASDAIPIDSTQSEIRESVSELKSKEDNLSNSSLHPVHNHLKPQESSNENVSNSSYGTQNTSSNVQHFMSTLGSILHSMKGNGMGQSDEGAGILNESTDNASPQNVIDGDKQKSNNSLAILIGDSTSSKKNNENIFGDTDDEMVEVEEIDSIDIASGSNIKDLNSDLKLGSKRGVKFLKTNGGHKVPVQKSDDEGESSIASTSSKTSPPKIMNPQPGPKSSKRGVKDISLDSCQAEGVSPLVSKILSPESINLQQLGKPGPKSSKRVVKGSISHDSGQNASHAVSRNLSSESTSVKQRGKPGPKPGFKRGIKHPMADEGENIAALQGQDASHAVRKNTSPESTNIRQRGKPGPKSSKTIVKGSISHDSGHSASHAISKSSSSESTGIKQRGKPGRKPGFKIGTKHSMADEGESIAALKGQDASHAASKHSTPEIVDGKRRGKRGPKPGFKRGVKRPITEEDESSAAEFVSAMTSKHFSPHKNVQSSNEMMDNSHKTSNPWSPPKKDVEQLPKSGRKLGNKRGVKWLNANDGENISTVMSLGQGEVLSTEACVTATQGQKSLQMNGMRTTNAINKDRSEYTQKITVTNDATALTMVKGPRDGLESGKVIENVPMSIGKLSGQSDDEEEEEDATDSMADSSCTSSDSSDDADVEYICKLCSKSYNKRSHLKKHMKTHYKGVLKKAEKKVICKGCRRKFMDTTALQAHLLQRRYCFFDCTRPYWKKKGSSLKACRMCGKGQAKWKDLKKHFYRDLTCRLRFIDLILERNREHDNAKLDISTECKTSEKSKNVKGALKSSIEFNESISEDSQKKESEPSLQATVEKQFSEVHELPGQEESVTSKNCGSCKKFFATPALLRDHLNKSDKCKEFYLDPKNSSCPIKLNYCSQCCIFMSSGSRLLSHRCGGSSDIVTCNICLKTFVGERAKRVHQRLTSCGQISNKGLEGSVNTKGKVSQALSSCSNKPGCSPKSNLLCCAVCGRSFKQIQELLEHSYSHTEQGQYDCLDCSMEFERYNSLVSHMIWHRRKLDCEKKDSKNEATSNKRKESAKLPSLSSRSVVNKCPYCPLRFRNKARYNAHCRNHLLKQSSIKACDKQISKIKKEKNIFNLNDTKFSCLKCNQRFSTLFGRNDHALKCDVQLPVAENNNDEAAVTSNNTLESSNYFMCSLCSIVILKKSFWYHLKWHQQHLTASIKRRKKQPLVASEKMACVICNKVYSRCKVLIRHVLLHKSIDIMRPVNTSTQSSLKRPRIHPSYLSYDLIPPEGEKSPISPSSSSKGGIARKIAIKKNRFSCKVCGKKLSNVAVLKFHLKVKHRLVEIKEWSKYVSCLEETEYDTHPVKSGTSNEKQSISSTDAAAVVQEVAVPMKMCEICQKVMRKNNYYRHLKEVHGLPSSMLKNKGGNSQAMKIKQEMTSQLSKGSVLPIISVDGAKISKSFSNEPQHSSVKNKSISIMDSSQECRICGKWFLGNSLRWKHFFSHIKPCSIGLMRLDDIIQEIPSGLENGPMEGVDDDDVSDSCLPNNVDISVADEEPVSFDVGDHADTTSFGFE